MNQESNNRQAGTLRGSAPVRSRYPARNTRPSSTRHNGQNVRPASNAQPRTKQSSSRTRVPNSVSRSGNGPASTGAGARNALKPPASSGSVRIRHDTRPRTPGASTLRKSGKPHGTIPEVGSAVRIIPLGGVEEVGKNMTAIEVGDDIVIIDAGFQFREEETPGVDYILPNTTYLEERKHKIRALIVTHGHLDHIGGIPYIMDRIGNPPIYSRLLTTVMIKKRQDEFPHLPALNITVIEKGQTITLGKLKISFFAVTHTIPDAMGVIVDTPHGAIVHTGDLKLDHIDGVVSAKEEEEFSIFKQKNVLCLMADSTNVEKPGFSIPEQMVHQNIEEIIKKTPGRLIIGTFASQLERIIRIIEICEQYNKKVVIEGRSMKNNIEIVKHLGLLKIKPTTIIAAQEMESFPPERIVALSTGAQGDEFAALMRMANKTNKYFQINKRDTILLSSSIIPGNERAVQKLKDNLSRQGAKIIHYQVADVHSSGHANRDETAWIHQHIAPKFFIPVHGYHYMLRVHAEIARSSGIREENIILPDNGMVIDIIDDGERIVARKERAPSSAVLVDGFSIGDVQEVVLRDRQMLAQDGMFVIIASLNPKTGKLRKSPDIISRGFVYLRESQDLLQQARFITKKTIEDNAAGLQPVNFDYIKGAVSDNIGRYLFQETNKRPIVIPVIIGV